MEYLEAYEENLPLKKDWEQILELHPKKILYGHANEQILQVTDIPARCTIDDEKHTYTD